MNSHHAYILFADSIASSGLKDTYKTPATDVAHTVVPTFSIDDARQLTQLASQRPFVSDTRVFVIQTQSIAYEAQNALLKLFEEPPSYAVFYLLITPTTVLLPTLRSRLMLFEENIDGHEVVATPEVLTSFLKLSYGERISLIAQKVKDKEIAWAKSLVGEAEERYGKDSKRNAVLLKTIVWVESYMQLKGASLKMLLEELALSLPKRDSVIE